MSRESTGILFAAALLVGGCGGTVTKYSSGTGGSSGTGAGAATSGASAATDRGAGAAGGADMGGATGGGTTSEGAGQREPGTGSEGPPETRPPRMAAPDLSMCPAMEPSLGSPCTPEALVCSYGNAVLLNCRHSRRCAQGKWIVDDNLEHCEQPPTGYCPQQIPAGDCQAVTFTGEPVTGNGQPVCDYPDGTSCVCNVCAEGSCASHTWTCIAPPEQTGCPVIAPNLGTPCDVQGTECTYGIPCQGGGRFICKGTTWYPLSESCLG